MSAHQYNAYTYGTDVVHAHGGNPSSRLGPADAILVPGTSSDERCFGMKKNGEPCMNVPAEGTNYCIGHQRQNNAERKREARRAEQAAG